MIHRLDHVSTYGEFTELRERAAGVRLLFETARTELLSHVKQHHAGRQAVSVTV